MMVSSSHGVVLRDWIRPAHVSDNAWFDFYDGASIEPHKTSTHVLYQRFLISKAYYRRHALRRT